ncbi:MAG: quinol monooxygenase YgiN [Rhodothermales bacterium]|jgi:quinol monooxygenase YgiN
MADSGPEITRLVRLTLLPEAFPAFEDIFAEAAPRIRSSPGCHHLELWRDIRYPNVVSTYSRWSSEAALNAYRETEFFRLIWGRTKMLFAAPPFAATHVAVEEYMG